MANPKNLVAPPSHLINDAVEAALREDLGLAGDLTTLALIPEHATTCAAIVARTRGVICGQAFAKATFETLDPDSVFSSAVAEGGAVEPGTVVAHISGHTRAILTGERVALNFMGRLSGVATLTRAYVEKVAGTHAKIVDTRKTTPGLRAFEKYAVRCGGGNNHRAGLFDAVMIKDNHIAAAGDISSAIARAHASVGHTVRIEVEVDTLAQLDEVLVHEDVVDAVLLDNMDVRMLEEAVTRVAGRIVCEASGGISLDTVADIAGTGVDVISVGALTHSAPVLDLGLDFDAPSA